MDRYTKAFIVASLVYFVLASLLGLWMGVGDPPSGAGFAHVHFNLLGFMAMMVYGVGYFVLPRFNARTLRWPSWVAVHFYVANVGLLGMVVAWMTLGHGWFALFSSLSVLSVFLFAVNLGATLLTAAPEESTEELPRDTEKREPAIGPDTRVGEILTRWPEAGSVLANNGFPALGDPAHQEQVKQMPITVSMACARHGVEVDHILDLLKREIRGRESNQGDPIGPDQVLGEILAAHPETEAVFRKYYGSGCFSCPGQATETVRQSAMIHNVDVNRLLEDLNRAAA